MQTYTMKVVIGVDCHCEHNIPFMSHFIEDSDTHDEDNEFDHGTIREENGVDEHQLASST